MARYSFTKTNVDRSPAKPGVYMLYSGETLIYVGSSEASIRSRLQRHRSGEEGRGTAGATHYDRLTCSDPLEMEASLLRAHKRQYGKLPRCNEVMPNP